MSVKYDCQEDSEAMSLALDIVDKYSDKFEGIDVAKIRFLRVKGRNKGKGYKVTSVGFPFNYDITGYLYYIEIDDDHWKEITDEQKFLLVYSSLLTIAPGGMDPECVNYGKKRKKDIDDYRDVIEITGGRYDWNDTGASGIRDILNTDDKKVSRLLDSTDEI